MALVNIVFGRVGGFSGPARAQAIRIRASENVVPSGINQITTASVQTVVDGGPECVQVTCDADQSVYVAFGPAADATAAPRALVLAGQTRDFWPQPGDKVAIVEV